MNIVTLSHVMNIRRYFRRAEGVQNFADFCRDSVIVYNPVSCPNRFVYEKATYAACAPMGAPITVQTVAGKEEERRAVPATRTL